MAALAEADLRRLIAEGWWPFTTGRRLKGGGFKPAPLIMSSCKLYAAWKPCHSCSFKEKSWSTMHFLESLPYKDSPDHEANSVNQTSRRLSPSSCYMSGSAVFHFECMTERGGLILTFDHGRFWWTARALPACNHTRKQDCQCHASRSLYPWECQNQSFEMSHFSECFAGTIV